MEDEEVPQVVMVPTTDVARSAMDEGGGERVVARTCLLNMCGLPGAGKSTLARALAAHLADDDHDICVSLVSFDDIEKKQLSLMHSTSAGASGGQAGRAGQPDAAGATTTGSVGNLEYDAAVWRAARKEAFARLNALLTADVDDDERDDDGDESDDFEKHAGRVDDEKQRRRRRRHLVIADDNFYYASMRYQVHQLARRTAAAHVQLHVDVTTVRGGRERGNMCFFPFFVLTHSHKAKRGGCSVFFGFFFFPSPSPHLTPPNGVIVPADARYVLEVAHRRNERRTGEERVPREALERMAAALEPPDPEKRPFERNRTAVVDATFSDFPDEAVDAAAAAAAAWERVRALWGAPPPMPATEEERAAQRWGLSLNRTASTASPPHPVPYRGIRCIIFIFFVCVKYSKEKLLTSPREVSH